jgi:hypothetical protein
MVPDNPKKQGVDSKRISFGGGWLPRANLPMVELQVEDLEERIAPGVLGGGASGADRESRRIGQSRWKRCP